MMGNENKKHNSVRSEFDQGHILFKQSDSKVYESIRMYLAEARAKTFNAINIAMVLAYWEIGREIAEAVGDRAEYGKKLLPFLSEQLTSEFGKGFTVRNLRNMRQFYQTFPIRHALRTELTWTHYRMLVRIEEQTRREFYLTESADSGWTSRQLEQGLINKLQEFLLELGKGFSFVARQKRISTRHCYNLSPGLT